MAKVALGYGAMTSLFHDGTRTGLADILYPFAVAYRWGAEGEGTRNFHDPDRQGHGIAPRAAGGLRPTGIDAASKSFRVGDLEFAREMQLVEVYLNAAPDDLLEAAPAAPPWADVPWHVIALMEEAVARGFAAFSEQEARRRGVPWLDLARDAPLQERPRAGGRVRARRLRARAAREHGEPGAGAARWQALAAFHAEHGHFLVTNGPMR